MTHICLVNWDFIGLSNGVSPVRCQATTWTTDEITLYHCDEILMGFSEFSSKNVLDYVVWKRVVTLFFPQCGKEWWPTGVNWLKGNCLLSIRLSLTNGFLQQQLPYATLFVWLSVEFKAAISHLSTFYVWHCFEKKNRNTYTLNNLKMFISIGTVCKTLFISYFEATILATDWWEQCIFADAPIFRRVNMAVMMQSISK